MFLCVVDEHDSSIQKAKEAHLQQLEEVKRAKESSGFVSFLSFQGPVKLSEILFPRLFIVALLLL